MKVSITKLTEWTGYDRRTVTKRLDALQAEVSGRSHLYASEEALPLIYGHSTGRLDPGQERAKLHRAQEQLTQLRKSELEGGLVSAADVLLNWQHVANVVRARLLALPAKLSAVLTGQHDYAAIHDLIKTEVYTVLDELGDTDHPEIAADGNADR